MDISESIQGSDSYNKKLLLFFNEIILNPLIFIKDLFHYILSRVIQLYRFGSAFNEVLLTIFTRFKNWLVSKMFWGRGDLYKFFFRGSFIVAFFAWGYSSFWGGASYASNDQPNSTYVLQQQDFEVELGSSAPPIDEDRPRDSVREYVVQGGDTLSTIAEKFEISISTIKWANNLSSDYIKPGQKLKILPVTGVLHIVGTGDTLASVATEYNASEQAIADVNWIDPPFNLTIGDELMVPGGEIKVVVATVTPTNTSSNVNPSVTTSTGTTAAVPSSGMFVWPAGAGYISQYYHQWHKAIDIASHAYPDIYAADAGTVVYSGWDSTGYGLTILIDHGNGYQTRYAHASSLYVKTGDYVTRGQAIMKMGSTGRSTGPHLHFEIKYNGIKQNPMAYY